jgi:hypothetical protein
MQLSPPVQEQNFVHFVRLSAIETTFLEMQLPYSLRGFGNLPNSPCDMRCTRFERDVCLRDYAHAPPPIVHNRDSANLVFLHEFFAEFQSVVRLAGYGNTSHNVGDFD